MEVDVVENVFVEDSVEAPSSTVERSAQVRTHHHMGAAPLLTNLTPANHHNVTSYQPAYHKSENDHSLLPFLRSA